MRLQMLRGWEEPSLHDSDLLLCYSFSTVVGMSFCKGGLFPHLVHYSISCSYGDELWSDEEALHDHNGVFPGSLLLHHGSLLQQHQGGEQVELCGRPRGPGCNWGILNHHRPHQSGPHVLKTLRVSSWFQQTNLRFCSVVCLRFPFH